MELETQGNAQMLNQTVKHQRLKAGAKWLAIGLSVGLIVGFIIGTVLRISIVVGG